MKKKQFSKSDIKELAGKLNALYGKEDIVSKKDNVYLADDSMLFLNGKPAFFMNDRVPVPTLKFLLEKEVLKNITVDMGAVKFVVGGADIMRPGITDIPEGIEKGDAVLVVDENNKKPLAVAIALYDSEEMQKLDSGKVLKNIHYVGDAIWNY